jgi:hypothetical protein
MRQAALSIEIRENIAGRACKVAWKKGDVIGIKFV